MELPYLFISTFHTYLDYGKLGFVWSCSLFIIIQLTNPSTLSSCALKVSIFSAFTAITRDGSTTTALMNFSVLITGAYSGVDVSVRAAQRHIFQSDLF